MTQDADQAGFVGYVLVPSGALQDVDKYVSGEYGDGLYYTRDGREAAARHLYGLRSNDDLCVLYVVTVKIAAHVHMRVHVETEGGP